MNITIIANGSFPTKRKPLTALGVADWVVCCDGALGKYLLWCRKKSAQPASRLTVVGDGDSLRPGMIEMAREAGADLQQIAEREQESNDLSKAMHHVVEQCRKQGVDEHTLNVTLLGATGLREDHTIGNISLLAHFHEAYPAIGVEMVSDYGRFVAVRGKERIACRRGEQISLFSLTPEVPVSVKGLRYPIEGRCLTEWWQGTLNEAIGEHCDVEGGRLVVYLNDVACADTETPPSIRLDRVPNIRQLGGIRTADGRRVRQDLLFRSSTLSNATSKDLNFLHEMLHIRYVIDLRTQEEVDREPDKHIIGSEYVHMPIFDASNDMWSALLKTEGDSLWDKLLNFSRTRQAHEMMKRVYMGLADDEYCQLQYAAILNILVQAPEGAVLWHCAQGKDRTGMVAALLLFALGCDRETVVHEFDRSNEDYTDTLALVLHKLHKKGSTTQADEDVITATVAVKTSYFEDALDHIDELYGSMDQYLRDVLVLTDKDREILREKFLE